MSAIVPTVQLHRQRPHRVGHPWVFAGEIAHIPESAADGSVVRVVDVAGYPLGMAYINRRSRITLRYLTHQDSPITDSWWDAQIALVLQRRVHLGKIDHSNALRLVNGEADGLPGLIVDQYADVLVVQFLALGLEPWRDTIVAALRDQAHSLTIWERSDVLVRELEGLPQRSGLLDGAEPPQLVEVYEGQARLLVDVRAGQKTGLFLDQRRNRLAVAAYASDQRVLNCFAYSGAFGVHAGLMDARWVTNVDISTPACVLAEQNMTHNGLGQRHEAVVANCFDLLKAWSSSSERTWDMVILDPPAFTKNRESVDGALRGYKEINLRALRLLRPGGILVTCSCSQHIDDDLFVAMLAGAAHDAHRTVRILEHRGQGPDHPILLGAPETRYLTCIIAAID